MTTELHFATLFEILSDEFGDDGALRHGERTWTWREFDDESARFASYLRSVGSRPNSKVALLLRNCGEYLIAHHAILKQRGVPVNVNYRYLDDEICYLLDNSESEVVVVHSSFVDRVQRVSARCRHLRAIVVVDEPNTEVTGYDRSGTVAWSDVLAAHSGASRIRRSDNDIYLLYTGGTTGLPKGVMFRMGDFAQRMFTGYAYRGWTVPTSVREMVTAVRELRRAGERRVSIPACPMMHGTGMWLGALYVQVMAGTVISLTGARFDADELWATAELHGADALAIVGDAFARPMLGALDRAVVEGRPYSLDAMRIIQSSGVMWSSEVQRGLLGHLDVRLVDSMGSTEGAMARRIATRSDPIETATFVPLPGTRVLLEERPGEYRDVVPGIGEVGRVAASASVPLGYFRDEVKTAATFPTIDGRRYSLAGDFATVDSDGRIVLLGRGSGCINTMGEKVFPEEVEEAMKRHPAVVDSLVVGLDDPTYGGQRIAAVVSGNSIEEGDLLNFLRGELAGYKLPRLLRVVETIRRAPNGKPDYEWAREVLNGVSSG